MMTQANVPIWAVPGYIIELLMNELENQHFVSLIRRNIFCRCLNICFQNGFSSILLVLPHFALKNYTKFLIALS